MGAKRSWSTGQETSSQKVPSQNHQRKRRNLKLTFSGSVETQAQNGPDRLKKPRAGSDEAGSARPGLVEEAESRIG